MPAYYIPHWWRDSTTSGGVWEPYTVTTSTTSTWDQWINTETCTTNTMWLTWAGASTITSSTIYTSTHDYGDDGVVWEPAQPVTQEAQIRAIAEREISQQQRLREYAQQRAETDRLIALANERAEKLLLENLSLRQRNEYLEHKHFIVIGSSGRRFRIRRGRNGNVDHISPAGIIVERLCAHPSDYVPDPDTMLAQKLMLECDDREFMTIANRTTVRAASPILPALN